MPRTRGSSKKTTAPEIGIVEPQQLTSFSDLIGRTDRPNDEIQLNSGEDQRRAGGDVNVAPAQAKRKPKDGKKAKATEESATGNVTPATSNQARTNLDEDITDTIEKPPKAKKKDIGQRIKLRDIEGEINQAKVITASDNVSSLTETDSRDDEASPRPSTPLREKYDASEFHPKTPKFDPDVHGAEIDSKDVYNADEETTFISPKKIVLPLGVSPPIPASTVLSHIMPVVSTKESESITRIEGAPTTYLKLSRPATPIDPESEENAHGKERGSLSSTEAPHEIETQNLEPINPGEQQIQDAPVDIASMGTPTAIQTTKETSQSGLSKKKNLVGVKDKKGSITATPLAKKNKVIQIASPTKSISGSQAKIGTTAPSERKELAGKKTKKIATTIGKPLAKEIKKPEQPVSKLETRTPRMPSNPIVKAPAGKEQNRASTGIPPRKPILARTSMKVSNAKAPALSKDLREKEVIIEEDKVKGRMTTKARSYNNLKNTNIKRANHPPSDPTSNVKRSASVPSSPKAQRQRTGSCSSNVPLDRARLPIPPVKSSKPPTIPVAFKLPGEELAKKQAAAREARGEKRKKQEEEERERKHVKVATKPIPKLTKKPPQENVFGGDIPDGQLVKETATSQKAKTAIHVRRPSVTKTETAQSSKAHKPNGLKSASKVTPIPRSAPKADTTKVDTNQAATEKARALATQKGIETIKAWGHKKLGSKLDTSKSVKQSDKVSNSADRQPSAAPAVAPVQPKNCPE